MSGFLVVGGTTTVSPTPDLATTFPAADLAIAYGYNRIVRTLPRTLATGTQLPINKLSDALRQELARAGYDEVRVCVCVISQVHLISSPRGCMCVCDFKCSTQVACVARGAANLNPLLHHHTRRPPRAPQTLTMALCSSDDNFKHMLLEDPGNVAVTLANPKTEEFQIGRTSGAGWRARARMRGAASARGTAPPPLLHPPAVIPGLLKSLHANRAASMKDGMKLFEVTDVLLLDPATDVGARNERRLAALYTGPSAGFEVIHGLVNRLMLLLEVPPRPFTWEGAAAPAVFGRGGLRYHIEHDASVPSYFPGRGARVVVTHESGRSFTAGTLGVLHPRVLQNFDLALPVAVVELCVEPFL